MNLPAASLSRDFHKAPTSCGELSSSKINIFRDAVLPHIDGELV
jgi:hypothetical protein